jgi:tetratricopeptide (TPR) repeat protein
MPASARQLFETSVDQVRRGQLRPALGTLLQALAVDPGHEGALQAAGRICRLLGSEADARLFDELRARPDDAEALYALGYRMVDEGRPEVAAALLEKSLAGDPENTATRRELAFARLQSRDFTGCLRTLAPLDDDASLSETELMDVALVQAEAAFYATRRDLALRFLARAEEGVPEDDQRERMDALHGLLGRSARWPSLDSLGLREWHFIQHAGVILKVAGGYFEDGSRLGRYDILDLRMDMVAFLLQRLVHLLDRLGLAHQVVMPVSPASAPLAHALALALGVPCEEELTGRRGRSALLVAANALEFGPLLASLGRHTPDLRLFSLNLDWEHEAPVCPEVVGVVARRAFLPWEERYVLDSRTKQMRALPADERPAAEIGAELHAAMRALPDDGGTSREEFESLYMPLASQLVLGNEELHPHRRRFTTLSPCWPAAGEGAPPRGARAGGGVQAPGSSRPARPQRPKADDADDAFNNPLRDSHDDDEPEMPVS